MIRRFAAVVVTVLTGCGGAATPAAESAGTSDASINPDAPLGTFELAGYEDAFDTSFTTQNVTDSDMIRYVAAFDYPRGFDVMVDPNDPDHAIVQTSISFDLSDPDLALLDTWLGVHEGAHPEAVAWLRAEVEDYLAAPGAEISLHEPFGAVCANVFTIGSVLDPTQPASTIGLYFEREEFRGAGCS